MVLGCGATAVVASSAYLTKLHSRAKVPQTSRRKSRRNYQADAKLLARPVINAHPAPIDEPAVLTRAERLLAAVTVPPRLANPAENLPTKPTLRWSRLLTFDLALDHILTCRHRLAPVRSTLRFAPCGLLTVGPKTSGHETRTERMNLQNFSSSGSRSPAREYAYRKSFVVPTVPTSWKLLSVPGCVRFTTIARGLS